MLVYALIGLSLALLGVAGLQFTYLFYVDRLNRERRRHIQELEQKNARLSVRLEAAEAKLAEREKLLVDTYSDPAPSDEAWADVIEER